MSTHKHVFTELEWKQVVQKPNIFGESVQHTPNGIGIKEQNGSTQDRAEHSVVQYTRSIDTDEEEGDGASEVDQDSSSYSGTIYPHPLVGGEVTEAASAVVHLFQVGEIEGRAVRPKCVCARV